MCSWLNWKESNNAVLAFHWGKYNIFQWSGKFSLISFVFMRWINCKVYLFRIIGKLDLLINITVRFCRYGELIAKMCLVFHFSFIDFLCNITLLQLPLVGEVYSSTLESGLTLWFAWPMECHGIPHFLLEINLTDWKWETTWVRTQ